MLIEESQQNIMNSKVYKWCAVPMCKNTSIATPNKLFVYVPNKKIVRDKWLKLARRDPADVVTNSSIYFCEDHFDLPNDMENYMQYHVMKSVSQVRMKPGCIPKKFTCQLDRKTRISDTIEQPYIRKKRKMMCLEECEKQLQESSRVTEQFDFQEMASGSSGNLQIGLATDPVKFGNCEMAGSIAMKFSGNLQIGLATDPVKFDTMTSNLETDCTEQQRSAIKLEIESQNQDDNALISEDKQICTSHGVVYHDPSFQHIGSYGFHDHENTSIEVSQRELPKVEQENANDTQDFDVPSDGGEERILNHISEEIIIKTEENIKTDHQQEENYYYDFSMVKIEMETDDTSEQNDNNGYNPEDHFKVIDQPMQELPDDCYYRLPESYYSSVLPGTDCLDHMQHDKADVQQGGKSALEGEAINDLLKVNKTQKSRTAHGDKPDKVNKKEEYRCLVCFASYKKLKTYLRHKNEHFKKGTQKTLKNRREGRHLKMIRGIAHFRCDTCNKSYTCEESLKVHIKVSHEHAPIKIIKTEPQDIPESNDLSLIGHQSNTEPFEDIISPDRFNVTQCGSGPSLLEKSSELENIKYSILLLQQDSINAAEDTLNDVKKTYYCPECLKFFVKPASYRSHLNIHLKKKFMMLRNHKIGLLKELKDMNKFPYFGYDNRHTGNINADKHIKPINNEMKRDRCINEELSSAKECSKIVTTESQQVDHSDLGQRLNNADGIKGTLSKGNFQGEPFREISSYLLSENCVYNCSKCSESHVDPSAFREHLNQHLKKEIHLLYKKKKQMYILRHSAKIKTYKCEKCGKEYFYYGFLKKHRKICQGPPHNELNHMFLGFNMTSEKNKNKSEMENNPQHSESNSSSICDPAPNTSISIIANDDSKRTIPETCEGTILKTCENEFMPQPDSMDVQDGVEGRSTIESTIKALINETQHICPKCPRIFENLSLYWQHLNKHYIRERHLLVYNKLYTTGTNGNEKLYRCDQCDKSYVHKSTLDLHINSQHMKLVLPKNNMDVSEEYKCPCGKVYTRKSRMVTCFKGHIAAKELPRCSNCQYYFQNKKELNVHKQLVHTKHRYLCKFCPVEYYAVDSLFKHLEIHKQIQLMECKVIAENVEEKQYLKCFICKEISNDLNEFKLHFLNDHKKPYLCMICVKHFNDLDQFMSHTNTYHLSSRERWLLELLRAFFALMQSWECKPCSFRSENPDTLAEHLHNHKTLNVVGLDLMSKSENIMPKSKCFDCRRIYCSAKQLEEHRILYHNPDQSRKKISPELLMESDSTNKCLKCNIHFIAERDLKAHFYSLRHVEVQSFLLNEKYVSDNFSEIESKTNVMTID